MTGVNGQDGVILRELIPKLFSSYRMVGLSRRSDNISEDKSLTLMRTDYSADHLEDVLRTYAITHVLHLAGMSSVSHSFSAPNLAYESIFGLTQRIADACVKTDNGIRLVVANSSEIFGNCPVEGATLQTAMRPLSPYGSAKAEVRDWLLDLNEKRVLDCANLILFNHESVHRGENFVVKKLMLAAKDMQSSRPYELEMGSLRMRRDWGDAYRYMEAALHFLVSHDVEQILCSGHHASIYELARLIFSHVDIDFDEVYRESKRYLRASDITFSYGAPANLRDLPVDVAIEPQELVNRLMGDLMR